MSSWTPICDLLCCVISSRLAEILYLYPIHDGGNYIQNRTPTVRRLLGNIFMK